MTAENDVDTYEPSFEEISDPDSFYYDRDWFESELLPWDHEWASIIGDFLFMRATIRQREYTGNNEKLADQQKKHLDKFNQLIPEIEDLIRGEYEGLEFAQKWAELQKAFEGCRVIKREQKSREDKGRFDRGTEQRRAWFAKVYMIEKEKGKKGPVIKRDIARYAELIKSGAIPAPPLWHKLKFYRILHEKSTFAGPQLNNDLHRDLNTKEDIPYYAEKIAPNYKLPPFEIKTSG